MAVAVALAFFGPPTNTVISTGAQRSGEIPVFAFVLVLVLVLVLAVAVALAIVVVFAFALDGGFRGL